MVYTVCHAFYSLDLFAENCLPDTYLPHEQYKTPVDSRQQSGCDMQLVCVH